MSIECSCDLMLIKPDNTGWNITFKKWAFSFYGPPNDTLYSVIIECLPEGPPK